MPAGRPKGSGGVNKSAAIRDYLTNHPEASTTEVVEALGGKGIDVSQALVAGVRSRAGGEKKPRKSAAAPAGAVTADELSTVQAVIEKFEEPDVFMSVVEDVCGLIHGLGSVERLEVVMKALATKGSDSDESDSDESDSDEDE